MPATTEMHSAKMKDVMSTLTLGSRTSLAILVSKSFKVYIRTPAGCRPCSQHVAYFENEAFVT